MFKRGQVVRCINAPANSTMLENGMKYTVAEDQVGVYLKVVIEGEPQSFFADRFVLATAEKRQVEEEAYDLKLSSPHLINYTRMYHEVMVNGTRVAKVTIKVKGQEDRYVLLVHEDILRKARIQDGGQGILDLLHYFGIDLGSISRTLTISEWASAYELVKKLVKLPILSDMKRDTVVTVKPLEV